MLFKIKRCYWTQIIKNSNNNKLTFVIKVRIAVWYLCVILYFWKPNQRSCSSLWSSKFHFARKWAPLKSWLISGLLKLKNFRLRNLRSSVLWSPVNGRTSQKELWSRYPELFFFLSVDHAQKRDLWGWQRTLSFKSISFFTSIILISTDDLSPVPLDEGINECSLDETGYSCSIINA